MTITKKQEEQYRKNLERTRTRIKNIEKEMALQLEQTKKRLRELLEEKKAMLKIYDGLALLIGVENEFKGEGEEERIKDSNIIGKKI